MNKMKIIEKNCAWAGVKLVFGTCSSKLQLDDSDVPFRIGKSPSDLNCLYFSCPVCGEDLVVAKILDK